MRRVLVFDRFDAQVCELAENDVFELTRHEVVNGEHELSITTTQVLEKGWRVVMQDDRGYWHEWVVSGIDDTHANGSRPYGSYYCVWSLQPDLMGTRVSAMPGVQTPVTAAQALDAVLSGTSRWTRGTITNTNTGGASMYDTDGWSAMSTLVANWGGEVDTTISVSSSGVVSRQVDLYSQQGESTAKRRFDFGADLVSVRRTIADDPLYCRITPRGRGEETEGGGYGRKITIESVNGGKDYLVNSAMVDLAKLPDGNGGWEYPTLEVENSECETPSELLAWSQGVLESYTTPKVTYEVDVVQAAMEGVDFHGVSLGDSVQIVDGKFNDLRLTGRVMEITTDELAHTATSLTIGHIGAGISERFSDLYDGIKTAELSVTQLSESLATSDYIESLLDRINTEINATGGYTYIVPGNGILTFDVAVADPLNPTEAHQVVEIKGGSIRIANSKTAQGKWEWKTVFTSGHIAANLVTAAQLTTGYIGNASGTYWDLDNNLLHLPATTIMDDTTLGDIANQEIGGTNLLDDTNAPSLTKVAAAGNRYISNVNSGEYTSTIAEISDPPIVGIKYGQHLIKTSGTAAHSVSYYSGSRVMCRPGKTYTMSVYARHNTAASGKTLVLMYGYQRSGANTYPSKSFSMPNDAAWHRYSWTFTTPEDMDDIGIVAYPGSITTETCNTWFCGWKLEAGEKATDWSISTTDAVYPNTMIRAYGSGVLVCKQGNTVGALVNSNGSFDVVKVTWSGSTPTAGTAVATFGTSVVVGESTKSRLELSDSAVKLIYVTSANASHTAMKVTADETTIGYRTSDSTIGSHSIVLSGANATASGYGSVALGGRGTASGRYSLAANDSNTASGECATALGNSTTASGNYSTACGRYTIASGASSMAVGKYNVSNTDHLFIVGKGSATSSRSNALYLTTAGNLWIAGTLTQGSDRRLKQHVAYLGDDANVIINRLKPAVFIKDGGRHYGFYAQDVQRADIWDTKTVEAQHTDESLGFDPLTLDYSALIAPLTAYVQNLEKRIEELERRLDDVE